MTFSEKLLKKRRQLGFSQEELAERLEVSRQAVSRWENGTAMPDAAKLLALSDLFGVPVDALLRDEVELDATKAEARAVGRRTDGGKWWRITGILLAVLAVLGLLTLMICSSIEGITYANAVEIDESGMERMVYPGLRGLDAFLKFYDLEWLRRLCIACIPGGILMAALPTVVQKIKEA